MNVPCIFLRPMPGGMRNEFDDARGAHDAGFNELFLLATRATLKPPFLTSASQVAPLRFSLSVFIDQYSQPVARQHLFYI